MTNITFCQPQYEGKRRVWRQTWMIMRLTILFIIISTLTISAKSFSQKVSLSLKNSPIENVFNQIRQQTGYSFLWKEHTLDGLPPMNITIHKAGLEGALKNCLEGLPLTYDVHGKVVYIKRKHIPSLHVNPDIKLSVPPSQVVTGSVTDSATGGPLAGVTIKVKGKSIGTVTDANGRFSLEVPNDAVLVISFLGYRSETISVNGKTNFDITLAATAMGLNQLVVVGYGTQNRKEITTAISEINTADLKDLPITTSGQLLQGRASGISVINTSGAPGSPPSIRIHGISSINAGTTPLVVIDGFPVGHGIPQSLNPNDIAKISVLKDAASTSIYGARGSNGVILIQTKKAKSSQSEIEYNVSAGFQYVPKDWRPHVLNAQQYAEYNKERVEENNAHNNTNTPVPQVFLDILNNPQKYGKGTDWLDAFLREGSNAFFQKHNLTFRKGNENLKGVISGGYLNQEGVIPNTNFKRYSLNTNVQATLTDWFKAGGRLAAAYTERNSQPSIRGTSWDVLMRAITASPLQSPYDSSGDLVPYLPADVPGYFGWTNPLYEAEAIKDKTIGKDINAGLNLDIQIIEGLHYKPRIYARLFSQVENSFTPTTIGKSQIGSAADLAPGAPPFVNHASNQTQDLVNWGMDNLLTYHKEIGNHSFDALLGYTAQKQTGQVSAITAQDFPTNDHINYLEASEVNANISDYTNWSLAAFFGRINYNYKGKYMVQMNFRREGSSKFGSNNKYGNFPSASVGWRISDEEFYPQNFFVNNLKIRASYGKTGNSSIGDYDRLGRIISIPNLSNIDNNYNYVLNNNMVIGKALTSLGNQSLKWETSRQLDIGLTLRFFNNLITLKADYYRKITEDMLFNVTLPQASGFSSMRINAGKMLNKGLDFEINSHLNDKEFSWNSSLNISLLQNKVISIPPQIKKIIASDYNVTEVGEPVGALYGYEIEGIFNSQKQLDNPNLFGWNPSAKGLGAFIYKDVNGDGKISPEDKTVIGNPHPHVILGFSNGFKFRNLSLSILTTGAFGYQIIAEKNEWLYNEKGRWNVSTAFLHRWKSSENPGNGIIPAIYYAGQHHHSNRWTESGNHIWVKNVTLGYTIPNALFSRIKYISGLRFYVSIQNALRFTNYSGWNPEVNSRGGGNAQTLGIDNFSYPITRTYTLGANINF